MGKDVNPYAEGPIDWLGYLAALLFMLWLLWIPIFVTSTILIVAVTGWEFSTVAKYNMWCSAIIEIIGLFALYKHDTKQIQN